MKRKLAARVSGRVQGVGYRYFARETAVMLGLGGFARNLPGGDVEVEAEGERESLERLLEALRKGPPASRVSGVEAEWSEPEGGNAAGAGFRILF
ncbi:MAG: Acylphosphatase [bacterium ADurb.Bin236]|mgnify:FL=1|nr:MAG: Acylphosphatase [bacterium ADurb.Bin236]HOY63470.1 acylphosphatase [bacterium]HPN94255.1 acylphosphatase [bacterium]